MTRTFHLPSMFSLMQPNLVCQWLLSFLLRPFRKTLTGKTHRQFSPIQLLKNVYALNIVPVEDLVSQKH